ncbi:hypothetical protein RR48_15291 [Papilio machaon]|uniref:Uncharacterized protein n=1 Tax=Papilio machaon TaxID=76193 RepID=A0A194QW08_PAPMA|nr:hypothetical protein RR48_15291 [Papilio machaon]
MSQHTMIDNAVVIFGIIFTTFALARSIIVRVLYQALTLCIRDDNTEITSHYLLFVVLPLSSEFLHVQKVFTIYIFFSVMCSLSAYLALLTLTISKLLHNEFRSVKVVYMVGILCFCCCNLSYPVAMLSKHKLIGLIQGINLTVLYLGGFKVAVVMWLYGIGNLSTDIQFSLGFKPTQFWTTCWAMHPILTFNLVGVLKPRPKYGPPEPEDRARRRKFDTIKKRIKQRAAVVINKFVAGVEVKMTITHVHLLLAFDVKLKRERKLSQKLIIHTKPANRHEKLKHAIQTRSPKLLGFFVRFNHTEENVQGPVS